MLYCSGHTCHKQSNCEGRLYVQFDYKLPCFCVASWAFLVFFCQDVRPQSSLGGGGSRFLKKAPPPPAVNSSQSPVSKIRMQQVPEPRYSSLNASGTNVPDPTSSSNICVFLFTSHDFCSEMFHLPCEAPRRLLWVDWLKLRAASAAGSRSDRQRNPLRT